jgi:hypothetical protein
MAAKKDYFGLDRTVSLILAIIPFTSWICGSIVRFQEGKVLAGLVRLLTGAGFGIIWIVDIVKMVTDKKIWRAL